MISITYIILTHGEEDAFKLIDFLKQNKNKEDKILVLNNPTTPEYETKLKKQNVKLVNQKLDGDYSSFRNSVIDKVSTDYQFWLDADEQPHIDLMRNLKAIIEENRRPDAILTPRKNVVTGIKPIDALLLNFSLQGEVVCWPDPQLRIIKSRQGLRWEGMIHEHIKLEPDKHTVLRLPVNEEHSIIHTKTIDKQWSTQKENCERYKATDYYKDAVAEQTS